jgi:Domain of unknown function (DUF5666)
MRLLACLFSCLSFALLTSPGCAELGQIAIPGDYGGAPNADVVGEVRNVDTRTRQIEIRTDTGRTWNIQYDNQTKVVYRQRDYAVSNLEPGDYVAVSTEQDRDGRLYADLVTVKESVQERTGSGPQRSGSSRDRAGRLDRLEGTVENIDSRRGQFEVRGRDNRTIIVSLQYNAPRSVSDRFDRLREGETVRVEGRFLNQERFELENFL